MGIEMARSWWDFARSAAQLVLRYGKTDGRTAADQIDDLASKGALPPINALEAHLSDDRQRLSSSAAINTLRKPASREHHPPGRKSIHSWQ